MLHCHYRWGFLVTKAGNQEETKRFLMAAACFGHKEALHTILVKQLSSAGKCDIERGSRHHPACIRLLVIMEK